MIRCPVCGKVYEPVLKPKPGMQAALGVGWEGMIQNAYPDAPDWQREQLLSGVCSDACWDELFARLGEDQECKSL